MKIIIDTAPTLHPDDEWLSIKRAAEYVKVSRRTIYHWMKKDRLVTCRTAGGLIRISKFSLLRDNSDSSNTNSETGKD